jgi:hypothetical protein
VAEDAAAVKTLLAADHLLYFRSILWELIWQSIFDKVNPCGRRSKWWEMRVTGSSRYIIFALKEKVFISALESPSFKQKINS